MNITNTSQKAIQAIPLALYRTKVLMHTVALRLILIMQSNQMIQLKL